MGATSLTFGNRNAEYLRGKCIDLSAKSGLKRFDTDAECGAAWFGTPPG